MMDPAEASEMLSTIESCLDNACPPDELWDVLDMVLEESANGSAVADRVLAKMEEKVGPRELVMMCSNLVVAKKAVGMGIGAKIRLVKLLESVSSVLYDEKASQKRKGAVLNDTIWVVKSLFEWEEIELKESSDLTSEALSRVASLFHALLKGASIPRPCNLTANTLLGYFGLFSNFAERSEEFLSLPGMNDLMQVLANTDQWSIFDLYTVSKLQVKHNTTTTEDYAEEWFENFEEEFSVSYTEEGGLDTVEPWSKLGLASFALCSLVYSEKKTALLMEYQTLPPSQSILTFAPYAVEMCRTRSSQRTALHGARFCRAVVACCSNIESVGHKEMGAILGVLEAIIDYVIAHSEASRKREGLNTLQEVLSFIPSTLRMELIRSVLAATQLPAVKALMLDKMRQFCVLEFEQEASPFSAHYMVEESLEMLNKWADSIDIFEQEMDPIMALLVLLRLILTRWRSTGAIRYQLKNSQTVGIKSVLGILKNYSQSVIVQAEAQLATEDNDTLVQLRPEMSFLLAESRVDKGEPNKPFSMANQLAHPSNGRTTSFESVWKTLSRARLLQDSVTELGILLDEDK